MMAIKKQPNSDEPAVLEPLLIEPETGPAEGVGATIPFSKIDSLMVTLSVELGRMDLRIRDLRTIRQSEVIPLDRAVGDPVDIRVNGKLIARGEVVSTENNRYGVRVTEIVSHDPPDATNAGAIAP